MLRYKAYMNLLKERHKMAYSNFNGIIYTFMDKDLFNIKIKCSMFPCMYRRGGIVCCLIIEIL